MIEKNINNRLYVPIIKWQQNERLALKFLDEDVKSEVLPCFEVRNSAQHEKLMGCFEEAWNAPAIIDYSNPHGLLTSQRSIELREFLRHARGKNHLIIPALNPLDLPAMADSKLLKSIAKHPSVAFRLRVNMFQVEDDAIEQCREALTTFQSHTHHLLIDFGHAPTEDAPVDLTSLGASVRRLKALGFASTHFISGAFPNDLSSVKEGSKQFPRHDIAFWQEFKHQHRNLSIGYGDYGVLSPGWTEEVLQRRGSRVAIKYTHTGNWLVLRGSNAKKEESIALSELMLTLYEDIFKGETYSWGDKIIADRANPDIPLRDKKSGGYHFAEAWNHHITFVVRDDRPARTR